MPLELPGSTLLVAEYRVGTVGCLEPPNVLAVELEVHGFHQLFQLLELRRSDDRRRHSWSREKPGESDLRRLLSDLLRDTDQSLDHVPVFRAEVHVVRERVVAGANRRALAFALSRAREKSPRERTPGNEPDP